MTLSLRARLLAVSPQTAATVGAWVGFAVGLLAGASVGAVLSWFAGAVLSWQRDLSFTLGVTERLLPLGDQIPALRLLSDRWYLVIPVVALVTGLLAALAGALIGAILASAYNLSRREIALELEPLPQAGVRDAAGSEGKIRPGEEPLEPDVAER